MNTIVKKVLSITPSFGLTALRIPVGLIFAAHGAQKLFGWFGGYGLEGTGQWLASVGFQPGFLMALLLGSAEFFGGLALGVRCVESPSSGSIGICHVFSDDSAYWQRAFSQQ